MNIFEAIEPALEAAGYKILDGDRESVIARDSSGTDYEIKVIPFDDDDDD